MAIVRGPVTRRAVFKGAAAMVAAAAMPLSPTGAGAAAAGSPLFDITRSTFAPHLNGKFRIGSGLRSTRAVLTEISGLPDASATDEHAFSLVFKARRGDRLTQAVRPLSHSALGSMSLLVVPVDRGVKAQYYQIIVNNRPLASHH
jgi:hypothetical protein